MQYLSATRRGQISCLRRLVRPLSTRDQNPALQVDAAQKLGVKSDDIYVEKAIG